MFYLIVSHADVDLHNCFFGWRLSAAILAMISSGQYSISFFYAIITPSACIYNPVFSTLQFVNNHRS